MEWAKGVHNGANPPPKQPIRQAVGQTKAPVVGPPQQLYTCMIWFIDVGTTEGDENMLLI